MGRLQMHSPRTQTRLPYLATGLLMCDHVLVRANHFSLVLTIINFSPMSFGPRCYLVVLPREEEIVKNRLENNRLRNCKKRNICNAETSLTVAPYHVSDHRLGGFRETQPPWFGGSESSKPTKETWIPMGLRRRGDGEWKCPNKVSSLQAINAVMFGPKTGILTQIAVSYFLNW